MIKIYKYLIQKIPKINKNTAFMRFLRINQYWTVQKKAKNRLSMNRLKYDGLLKILEFLRVSNK